MENLYSGYFGCDCRILDGIASGITDFRQSIENCNAGCVADNLILCTQK